MASNLNRRVTRLEEIESYAGQVFLWREVGQTYEEALAARFPEGVPPGVRVLVIGWEESAGGQPQQVSIASLQPLDGGEYGRREPMH